MVSFKLFLLPSDSVECPFSWININGHCYKFLVASTDTKATTCANQGGYLASFLDQEEMSTIRSVINVTRTLRHHTTWSVGLFDNNLNGVMRWSNGQFFNYSTFDLKKPTVSRCHGFKIDSKSFELKTTKCVINGNPFICEKGSGMKSKGIFESLQNSR